MGTAVMTTRAQNGVFLPWVTGPSLPVPIQWPAMVRTGGYVYVVGGFYVSGGYGNGVYSAAINGTAISPWTTLANLPNDVEAEGIAVGITHLTDRPSFATIPA